MRRVSESEEVSSFREKLEAEGGPFLGQWRPVRHQLLLEDCEEVQVPHAVEDGDVGVSGEVQ